MSVTFRKMHGAANDFIVIDHRRPFLPAERGPLFARMCERRRGIGADGVLLLERDPELDFAMVYHNADGGAADFCGNGARCLARFALDLGLGSEGTVYFRSAAGTKSARGLRDGRIELRFGPEGVPENVEVEVAGRRFAGAFVTAGVPHFVVPVERVADVPLGEWAPQLRRHARFGDAGANVDFVARRADGRIDMRTYERGVEGETLACGSGAIATALVMGAGASGPIVVRTSGGDDLEVGYVLESGQLSATLKGPAETVYTGEWPV